jgi:putative ABC transport system permease protein
MKPPGDINNIYIFSVLAFFIIIIAIINFINLTTASSETRAREIGLRKVMGAHRKSLFKQFISETMLITLLSLILALGITEFFIDEFRLLMDSPILLLYKTNILFLSGLIISVIIIGFIAGSYPALHLSRYLAVDVLKGSKSSSGKKSVFLQRSLVVFQFTIATFLLISLNLVHKQISFVKNKDLGFDKDHVIVLDNLTDKITVSFESLKSELNQIPEIIRLTGSRSVPGTGRNMSICYKEGNDASDNVMVHNNEIYYDYVKTYGIELISGREFDQSMGTDTSKVILNETAAKALGLTDPLNQKLMNGGGEPFQIIGIMKDFHFASLHQEIGPIAYFLNEHEANLISIKLSDQNIEQSIKKVEASLKKFDPNYTFSYKFIDESFAEMYEAEDRINKLITYASVLALIISILGLIALTMQTIQKKIHEIGIRKVMGAEISQVVKMFVLDVTKWVVLATIIAIPIAYLFTSKWLENFVFRTRLGIDIFVIGCLASILISILTVGIISYNSARANPIDSLKYE